MKKLAIIIGSLTLLLCIIIGILIVSTIKFDTDSFTRGTVIFKYDEYDIREEMNEEDSINAARILDGKILYKDSPSCGFSKNVSVRFKDDNGKVVTCCIANDTCPIVYVSERNKYITLSEKEAKELRSITAKYGMTFPCI